MRDIKFRGRRLDNGEWAYGCLTRYSEEMAYIVVDVTDSGGTHKVDAKTVGQFTGLNDKNGAEVYEGDILQYEDLVLPPIEWGWAGFNFSVSEAARMDAFFAGLDGCDITNFEPDEDLVVIGNIHENPEFLEQKGEDDGPQQEIKNG